MPHVNVLLEMKSTGKVWKNENVFNQCSNEIHHAMRYMCFMELFFKKN